MSPAQAAAYRFFDNACWSAALRVGVQGVDSSCLSGALVDELDDPVRNDLVLGDGGGDHCDFASANVGA